MLAPPGCLSAAGGGRSWPSGAASFVSIPTELLSQSELGCTGTPWGLPRACSPWPAHTSSWLRFSQLLAAVPCPCTQPAPPARALLVPVSAAARPQREDFPGEHQGRAVSLLMLQTQPLIPKSKGLLCKALPQAARLPLPQHPAGGAGPAAFPPGQRSPPASSATTPAPAASRLGGSRGNSFVFSA